MKKIIYFSPICEWNDFVNFNGFLLEKRNSFDLIGAVVPLKAASIITECDFLITTSEKYFKQDYPYVLENVGHVSKQIILGDNIVPIHVRNTSNFFLDSYNFIKSKKQFNDFEISFFETEAKLYEEHYINSYKKLFTNLNKIIDNKTTIKPSIQTFEKIKNKYENLFDGKKNYILITRNFSNKATDENTINLIPNLKNIINYLTSNDIKIINVGFPCQPYDIKNKNYLELSNESLKQDELVALMYLSDGVLLSGRSGGFAAHVLSNCDMFLIHPEWSLTNKEINIGVFENRKKNFTMFSSDVSKYFENNEVEKILEELNNHQKVSVNVFKNEKKQFIIDE